MSLQVANELPVTIKYDALMFVATPEGPRPARTSSCPVLSGTTGFETWPQPLTMLLLSNFRIINPENGLICQ
jgi:hypothetical protein